MRLAAICLAIAAAVLKPSGPDWQLALPAVPSRLLVALDSWTKQPVAVPVPHRGESEHPTCVCDCPAAEPLEPALLAWAFAAGIAAWPAADVVRLCKLAWHRQVAAAERALQLRAPDRP